MVQLHIKLIFRPVSAIFGGKPVVRTCSVSMAKIASCATKVVTKKARIKVKYQVIFILIFQEGAKVECLATSPLFSIPLMLHLT